MTGMRIEVRRPRLLWTGAQASQPLQPIAVRSAAAQVTHPLLPVEEAAGQSVAAVPLAIF
jgi:hypothetical protein